MRRAVTIAVLLLGVGIPRADTAAARDPAVRCLAVSGDAGARCLRAYSGVIEQCRNRADAACEATARSSGGALDTRLAAPADPIESHCNDATAERLGYLDVDDVAARVPEACQDFAEDLFGIGIAADPVELSVAELHCQRRVTGALRRLRDAVVSAFGRQCFVPGFAGGRCDRARRDQRLEHRQAQTRRVILAGCGAEFDGLGLAAFGDGSTLAERVDSVVDRVTDRARHFAQRVYPPNALGPTADFGPFPVGVRTLALADPARLAASGAGSRPVVTEVYYPSTPEAVAGVPRDVVTALGLEITETPAFRDVTRAAGTFPLVVFSHGNNGIRIQSFFFAAHLASHGFVVASPDHHGNTFVDTLNGTVDPEPTVNRPLDMSFLIDTLLAMSADPDTVLGGAIDAERIGASGHSFGGYTVFALAGGVSDFGTFTEPRVKAIMPQAPGSPFPDAFFGTITIPTFIVGGSIDETTPFPSQQERPFDNLPDGPALIGLAQLIGGGHFTFSDFCEVPRDLLAFLGGFEEACEPRHLPWRHAHDIMNFLALNFFDATLNADADALARLAPEQLAAIEDLVYRSR